jgi:hypothetical protein
MPATGCLPAGAYRRVFIPMEVVNELLFHLFFYFFGGNYSLNRDSRAMAKGFQKSIRPSTEIWSNFYFYLVMYSVGNYSEGGKGWRESERKKIKMKNS